MQQPCEAESIWNTWYCTTVVNSTALGKGNSGKNEWNEECSSLRKSELRRTHFDRQLAERMDEGDAASEKRESTSRHAVFSYREGIAIAEEPNE